MVSMHAASAGLGVRPSVPTLRRRAARRTGDLGTLAVLVFATFLCFTLWATVGSDLDVGYGALAGVALLVLVAPFLRWVGAKEDRFDLTGLLFVAFSLKLVGSLVRLFVVQRVYDDVADAGVYHLWGTRLAPQFRRLDFSVDVLAPVPGTGSLRYITGLIYAVTGTDYFVGYLVFSTLAFVGTVFFYLAFVTAVPNGNHRRYALLVLLWPSMLFWPSSTGKDAWMVFAVGVTAYGAARVFAHGRAGYAFLGAGLAGTTAVRPHITLILFVAIFVAYLLRPADGSVAGGWFGKLVGVVALLVVGSLVVANVEDYFGIEELSPTAVTSTLDEAQRRSTQGGSGYDPVRVNAPIDYPLAVATVLFRPFPYEAHSSVMLATSAEGLLLMALVGLAAWSLWSAKHVANLLRTTPYALLAATYVAMFCFAFAAIGNFGILARQRSQLLPFLFVLLALPPAPTVLRRARVPSRALERAGGHSDGDDTVG